MSGNGSCLNADAKALQGGATVTPSGDLLSKRYILVLEPFATSLIDSHEAQSITAALEDQVRSGAPAAQIADVVAATWRHAEESLTPIIGPQGVTALYRRSLLLTSQSHLWLAGLVESACSNVDVAGLTAAMTKQESKDAAQAGGELLQTFYGLVSSLIGPSLTHRLLSFIWQTKR